MNRLVVSMAMVASIAALTAPAAVRAEAVLDVKVEAAGAAGRVTGVAQTSTPITIDCPGACSSITTGTTVYLLHAEPAAGTRFVGWSVTGGEAPVVDGCGSSLDCTISAYSQPDVPQCPPGVTFPGPGCILIGPNFATTTVIASFVASEPARPSDEVASSYLCWNKEMVDPVAYIDAGSDRMWQTGKYLKPQAVFGNVARGTNIGAYHLVCNMAGVLHETGQAIGGSGEIYDAQTVAQYDSAHAGGTDLNIYRVWKELP
jgi:hypothetical protein